MYEKTDENELETKIISSLIILYTEQLEEYDRSSFGVCMSAIQFSGVIVSAIAALLAVSKKMGVGDTQMKWIAGMITVLLLLIPVLITFTLYNFCMNCRRVAYLRGYLRFLEERENNILGENICFYNTLIDPKLFSQFSVNKRGPIAMVFFLLILFLGSVFGSLYMAYGGGFESIVGNGFVMSKMSSIVIRFFSVAVELGSIFFSGWYAIYLSKNQEVIEETYNKCKGEFTRMLRAKKRAQKTN